MKLKTIAPTRNAKPEASPSGGASAQQNVEAIQDAASLDSVQAVTRSCPTRASGAQPLFQHTVTVSQCQSKQRGMYHKCFSCAHSNARR